MKELLDTPMFGIILCILAFEIGLFLYKKTRFPLFNPLFISITLVIAVLLTFGISLDSFNKGADFISFFLGPATIILAVPLYRQLEHLKANVIPIIIGITVGCIVAVTSVYALARAFRLEISLGLSLIPKSITTPIGVEVSKQIGGIPSITVAAIIITGVMGAVISPIICRIFKITDKVAVGIAIGTSSHALGTTKAVELGETEGAMSGLAIGIAGLLTVFIAPIIARLL